MKRKDAENDLKSIAEDSDNDHDDENNDEAIHDMDTKKFMGNRYFYFRFW